MNMIKIGKFIAERRKTKNLTQLELAEKLHITDRAISKWECGRSLPDSSIMLELCKILEISVNELLSGEVLEMKEYNKQAELNLLEMKKQKEKADKRLLRMEIYLATLGIIILLSSWMVAIMIEMPLWAKIVIGAVGFVIGMASFAICFKIEQVAGYYECAKCHHKFEPTYKQSLLSMHMGRTKFMKCPECKQKSWCKKVLSKEN